MLKGRRFLPVRTGPAGTMYLVVIPSFLPQADQNDDNASNQQFVIPAKAGIQEKQPIPARAGITLLAGAGC